MAAFGKEQIYNRCQDTHAIYGGRQQSGLGSLYVDP
jgi:hypothetical protein